jgi:hypothetical protein
MADKIKGSREMFFMLVDQNPVHPLVAWARDEIVRLEAQLAEAIRVKEEAPAKKGSKKKGEE